MDIKRVIKKKGYTIEEVAKKMGISRVTLSQNISRNPTVATLERIASAVGCKVEDFFTEKTGTDGNEKSITCPHCGEKINIEIKKEEE